MEKKPYQMTTVIGLVILCCIAVGSNYLLWSGSTWREVLSFRWFGNEELFNDALFGKEKLVSFNGGWHHLLNTTVIRDADVNQIVVRTQDGSLTSIVWQYDMTEQGENIANFAGWLAARDIDFYYIQAPYKILPGYTQVPVGITDYSNENADSLLAILGEKQVNYVDLRAEIQKENKDRKGLFYRTDHHWQTKTAFWAYSKIGSILTERLGWDIPQQVLSLEEGYTVTSYPYSFLGSQGKRVGRLYVGVDQYDYIAPVFATDFTVSITKSDGTLREQAGSFTEALVYAPLLAETEDVETNKYACYFGGDYPEVKIKNNLAANDKKILVIKDSFALPFTAFLANSCAEIRMIDLRYFTGRMEDYIEAYEPDLVLMLYNPSSFGSKAMFQLLQQD
ncbi:MAG: hypothetical protein HFI72_06680 [Peptococcaceae bacterium]|nr:hypothetical protein [Peptococcaceae bacterium]